MYNCLKKCCFLPLIIFLWSIICLLVRRGSIANEQATNVQRGIMIRRGVLENEKASKKETGSPFIHFTMCVMRMEHHAEDR